MLKESNTMSRQSEIHPDMADLMAAKAALTRNANDQTKRTEWDSYGARLSRPYPEGMKVEDLALACPGAGRDGTVKIRVYRPAGAGDDAACVIFLHGGGFVKGSLDSGDSNAWGIADQTGAVVVSVDYRLAPEFIYPAAVHDAYAVLKALSENPQQFGIDGKRIAFWGESAGANIGAGATLYARDQGGVQVVAQVLIYGPFSDDYESQSRVDFAEGFGLTGGWGSWDAYLGGKRPTSEPYAAPVKNPDLSGLPPALIHYAEFDILADDSVLYAERLKAAGSPVELRCAERMIHGFIRARFTGPTAAAEFAYPCDYLKRIFNT
jgi:acetyl esterase